MTLPSAVTLHIMLLKQGLLLNQELTFGGRLASQKVPGILLFLYPFPPLVYAAMLHFLNGNWESKLRSSSLCSRHIYPNPFVASFKGKKIAL